MEAIATARADEIAGAIRAAGMARLTELRSNRLRYDTDYPTFAADCLTIRPKSGADCLFRFNAVQHFVHGRAQAQLARTGKVRALVLKARQPGISTYVEGRGYWLTSRRRGIHGFILTHEQDATDNIFEMTERFHRHNPHAPVTGKSNAKELSFAELDSGVAVATAGAKAVGRSRTIQFFHGSEVGFWPNAEDHAAGALETVPDAPGTEVWLESTANGIGGLFYSMCEAAKREKSEFELIFVAWFAHDEYRLAAPEGWKPPPAFAAYSRQHGLTRSQTYWAFKKNAEMAARAGASSDEIYWQFQQEYPATAIEAFRASRVGSFISGALVAKARAWRCADQTHAPIIIGCDFATGGGGATVELTTGDEAVENEGGDQNVFIDRQGRHMGGLVYDRFRDRDTMSVANRLARLVDRLKPTMCFLDAGGGGAAVYDILCGRGYSKRLTLVLFGGRPGDRRKYANKRAEMWGELRDWLAHRAGAQVPDDDALDGDFTAPMQRPTNDGTIALERKDHIRKRLGFSPDAGDAGALTFAEPVSAEARPKPGAAAFSVADGTAGY